jgi:hypothetical protein
MLISGLEYLIASATLGAVWGVCRILYAVSYTRYGKRHPNGWYAGICAWFTQFGLFDLLAKLDTIFLWHETYTVFQLVFLPLRGESSIANVGVYVT